MEERLFTKQELASRWQVTPRTIENWTKEGIVSPVKNLPVMRFSEKHILEVEGTKMEATSPIRVRRLERELESVKKENEELRNILLGIAKETSKLIYGGV